MLFRAFAIWTILAFFSVRLDAQTGPPLLDRQTRFDSVEDFSAAVKAFEPAQAKNWLAYQFGAVELGQAEDDSTGNIVLPAKIESCTTIWSSEDGAVVFAVARPPTVSTHASVGVLFLLDRPNEKKWRIADCKNFTAIGKYASVECRLTSEAGTDSLTPNDLIATVTEEQGGRGVAYQISASFRILGGIVRADLN